MHHRWGGWGGGMCVSVRMCERWRPWARVLTVLMHHRRGASVVQIRLQLREVLQASMRARLRMMVSYKCGFMRVYRCDVWMCGGCACACVHVDAGGCAQLYWGRRVGRAQVWFSPGY